MLLGQLGELLNSLDFESLRRTNMKAAPHVCSINDSSRACPLCVGSAEAADHLGTNGKLVERLVEWCEAKDHAGVMGESNRLLSALIRHSKSKVRHHTPSLILQHCRCAR